ncbi:MAG TPA: putative metalloprotease CJM1_0395 family protein, partial [Spirochaetales bacterium]|nr:putative metalloprotease CJM1_0395 family protein [Spirochaetales bacterium]
DEDAAAARDAAVRSHERAHLSALGPYAASVVDYSTVKGDDGRAYATGASIKVDLAPVPGDPEASLRKARAVLAAAQAPGDPSAADQAVAAKAWRLAREAEEALRAERSEPGGGRSSRGGFETFA